MPGSKWKRSLKHPKQYEALRAAGMTKQRAAQISNAPRKKRKKGKR